MAFDSIWLATDLGDGAVLPYVHALRIGAAVPVPVTVLHVVGEGPPPWERLPTTAELTRNWRVTLPEIERRALVGPSTAGFLGTVVEAEEPTLLVLGTHRPGGLRRLFQGSVGEQLARRAAQSLIVPDGARPFVVPDTGELRLDRVVVPVGSARAQAGVDAAVRLLAALGTTAELVLVHVGPTFPEVRIPTGTQARRVHPRDGEVVGRVLEVVVAEQADLVVMATDGHDSLADGVWGSRTERVVRDAPVPLLSVRS